MKKWYNTHDSMTIIVMKLYFTPGKRPSSTFFSQWTNSGVSVDIFAHLKNILPKEFKFFRGYHWNFAKMLRLQLQAQQVYNVQIQSFTICVTKEIAQTC